MTSLKFLPLTAALIAGITTSSFAALLTPGNVLNPPPNANLGAGASAFKGVAGPVTGKDDLGNIVFNGSQITFVYTGDTNNPYPGGLTFVYQLSNLASSRDKIDQITLSGFTGFLTDVGYISDGVSFSPTSISRSSDGGEVRFNFAGNDISPGKDSTRLVVRTNAPSSIANTMSVIDGGVGTTSSYGPAVAGGSGAPEPTSLGLIGLGSMALLHRRRKHSV